MGIDAEALVLRSELTTWRVESWHELPRSVLGRKYELLERLTSAWRGGEVFRASCRER